MLLTAPYPQVLLDRVTATLRATADEFDFPHEVNLSFIALCNNNLVHLATQDDVQQVHNRLESMSGEGLVELARTVLLGIRIFLARPAAIQPRNATTTTTMDPSGGQSVGETPTLQPQAKRALGRDSSTCIVSGETSRYSEAAHIFPYSIGRSPPSSPGSRPTFSTQHPNLHTFLHLLAGSTITSMLESYLLSLIQSRSGAYWTRINRLENLFTLTPNLHRMWDDCVFTLIPIGDPLAGIFNYPELTSYSVTFQWLPQRQPAQLDLTQVVNAGQQMREEEDTTVSGPFVWNYGTNTRLGCQMCGGKWRETRG
ncbi:hypothetical protein BGX38DRAFT_1235038 [Terfezia claveryi]|nr:hypothetical protein BGX38DRAFT_1235038 [Terfezia claveryi]